MRLFLHFWNDNQLVNTPKAQPFYKDLSKVARLDKHDIIFGWINISNKTNIVEFINEKMFDKLNLYKHGGIFTTSSGQSRVFAHYLWSILLGFLRSGGNLNDVRDPDVIQAINLIKNEKSWLDCNVPDEIDLIIAYERNCKLLLEFDLDKFKSNNNYAKAILNEYNLLVSQDKKNVKINIPDPYKKKFVL